MRQHVPLYCAYALIVIGVISRLLPHPPNVTPLVAVALLGGAVLPRRLALLVPLITIMASDWIIGIDRQVAFQWFAFLAAGCLGWWLRGRISAGRVAFTSIIASTGFYLISNLGVWLVGRLYTLDGAGFVSCFVAALPFYRNMLVGDLGYTLVVFSCYVAVKRWSERTHASLASA